MQSDQQFCWLGSRSKLVAWGLRIRCRRKGERFSFVCLALTI
jgi:hypothetical protein